MYKFWSKETLNILPNQAVPNNFFILDNSPLPYT